MIVSHEDAVKGRRKSMTAKVTPAGVKEVKHFDADEFVRELIRRGSIIK